jgi:hypothetical protein
MNLAWFVVDIRPSDARIPRSMETQGIIGGHRKIEDAGR